MSSSHLTNELSPRRSLAAGALALALAGFMLAACANSHTPNNANEDTPASAYSGDRE